MPRPEKERKVAALADELRRAQAAVLTDYRGLTVQEASDLRTELGGADTRFAVVKNRLTKLAMREVGMDEGLTDLLEGPTAIAFVHGDPVAGVKRLVDSMKRFRVLEVKGGYAEGRALSAEQVRSLAALDSREVMLAKVAGLAKMEVQRMAWMLQALQSRFVSLMEALREKLPSEEQPAAAEAPASEQQRDEAEARRPEAQPAAGAAETEDQLNDPQPAAETDTGEAQTDQPSDPQPAAETDTGEAQTDQPSEEQAEGGT